jgi:hypothetical protein
MKESEFLHSLSTQLTVAEFLAKKLADSLPNQPEFTKLLHLIQTMIQHLESRRAQFIQENRVS